MNRRSLLKGTGGIAVGSFMLQPRFAFAQGTPMAGELATLTITIHDDSYDIPEGITAGRYAVSVVNAGSSGSHSSLGRLPDGVTNDVVLAAMASNSEEDPDWFVNAGYVGLPDWGAAGETLTGVVDLVAGNYFMFDPFAERLGFATVVDGEISDVEPVSDATVEMTEMRFILPDAGLLSGKSRLKVANIGAIAHEFQVTAVPEGTTIDQMIELFNLPFDATPTPDLPLSQILVDYHPAAATSIMAAGHTSWIDVDIAPGTYAVMCMLPFPGGVPHAMEGMLEIVTIA